MKQVVSAARRSEWHCRTLGEAFTDDGVKPVVNPILVFPQQLHHRVVRPADDTVQMFSHFSFSLMLNIPAANSWGDEGI